MKSNEILQALNLNRTKETINYTGKLANVFTFLKSIKADIKETAIVESDLTVNDDGKLLSINKLRMDYLSHLGYRFTQENKEYRINETLYRGTQSEISGLIRDKYKAEKKKQDTTDLQNKIDNLRIRESERCKIHNDLIESESERLNKIEFSIEDMRKNIFHFIGAKILVETNKGIYSFILPINNKFYYEVCSLLNIPYEVQGVIEKKVLLKVTLFNNEMVMSSIKKAAKFTDKEDLRPALQCICLDFTDNCLQVVATDAHRLYYSKPLGITMYLNGENFVKSFKPFQLLISPESIGKLAKSTPVKQEIYLTLFNDNTALINGIEVNLLPDTKYPDYKVVIPEYETKMTFDRAQMISNVKSVMVYSNKSTNQVNLNLNGDIKLTAQDVDFSFESGLSMPYIDKDFKDTEIGFNGKFLNEALSIFKSSTVTMYSEGQPRKAAIFTDNNNTDSVLLMPLMDWNN